MKTSISASEVPFEISMNHPKKCPSCGTENRVDSLLCCRCGAKFDGTASVSFTNVAMDFVSEFVLINGNLNINPFYICKYEVTQKLWQSVMGTNPSKFKGDNRPVECVSWYDAVEFCNKLSVKEGLTPCYGGKKYKQCNFNANGYRLPTAEEWEYAANGGQNCIYAGSNNIDEVAWYNGNSNNQTHNVGMKKPNTYGLYDISGNVWEWLFDSLSVGNCFLRGGSWDDDAEYCGSSRSRYYGSDNRCSFIGFRLVRTKV